MVQTVQKSAGRFFCRKIPWRREWQLTPVFSPGESHGQRSLAGLLRVHHKELDTTATNPFFIKLLKIKLQGVQITLEEVWRTPMPVFFFLCLCRVFAAARALSSCFEQGLLSSCRAQTLGTPALMVVALGLSSCDFLALNHGLNRCGAPGLAVLRYVGSSWIGDWTCVFCIGSWILHHWATREAPRANFLTLCSPFLVPNL